MAEENINSSKAYTVKFFIGEFRGKTPAQVLTEDPESVDKLLKQKEQLSANVARYPKNQDQIDAIDEAISLYENGMLAESVMDATPTNTKQAPTNTVPKEEKVGKPNPQPSNRSNTSKEPVKIEYPEQIYKYAKTDKTLGIDAKLFAANTDAGQSPLEMHAGFSRFVFTILSKSPSGKYEFVTANLRPDDLALMQMETEIAIKKLTEKSLEKKSSLSIAYTTTFVMGEFKGKTPADVLLEDGSETKKNKLLEYKKQLLANIAKYPRNKGQADAIDDAIHLLETGNLTAEGVTSQTMDIYRADIRAPHANEKDNEGYTDVYSFSIVCDLTKNYPFAVNILNAKAKVTANANGTITPNMSTAKNKKEFSVLLTKSEWAKALSRMVKTTDLFEQSIFDRMLKIAKDNTFAARQQQN